MRAGTASTGGVSHLPDNKPLHLIGMPLNEQRQCAPTEYPVPIWYLGKTIFPKVFHDPADEEYWCNSPPPSKIFDIHGRTGPGCNTTKTQRPPAKATVDSSLLHPRMIVNGTGDRKPTMPKNRFFVVFVGSVCLLSATLLHADTRKATKTSAPAYPALAAKMRVEGTVKVEAVINDEGAVEEAKVVSGHALLAPAAVEAVKKWKYEPGGGKTVQTINVDFVLPH
jgi:TonB family protein